MRSALRWGVCGGLLACLAGAARAEANGAACATGHAPAAAVAATAVVVPPAVISPLVVTAAPVAPQFVYGTQAATIVAPAVAAPALVVPPQVLVPTAPAVVVEPPAACHAGQVEVRAERIVRRPLVSSQRVRVFSRSRVGRFGLFCR